MSGETNAGIRPGHIGHPLPISGPFAAGKAAGASGAEESSNPHPHPSIASADWLRGHAEGMQERLAALPIAQRLGNREANGLDQEAGA
jgi:hypothetical protein